MTTDPYLWLEDVEGEAALAWVRERNNVTEDLLARREDFERLRADMLAIFDSKDRVPFVGKHGAHYYNFWEDESHARGVWRRTTPSEYRKPEPDWEILLDVDELNAAEGENWVWHGVTYLEPPEGRHYERCLVSLSRGGSDADVTREFDLTTKAFVPDGFVRPEAKGALSWIDRDRVFVFTDFGPDTLTTSGYARFVKEWRRGTLMSEAVTVYEGRPDDMIIGAGHDQTRGYERDFVVRHIAFYNNELYLRGEDGLLTKIDVPDSASKDVHRDWLYITPREPWEVGGRTYPAGALLVTRLDSFLAGERDFEVVFEPGERTSLDSAVWTKNRLLLNVLEDVRSRVFSIAPDEGRWTREPVKAPDLGTLVVQAVEDDESDDYFLIVTDFLTPTTLMFARADGETETLKSMPAFFNTDGLKTEQHFVSSADGTRVPYFVIGPDEGEPRPTVLNGYGGFEVPLQPVYMPIAGRGWLDRGGVFVVANIRGGGEYGPRWHQAALKENRFRAYEDFAAVAQDLVDRGLTTPEMLGIIGGRNGGLLVGNMLAHYPHLFGAIVCQVPLLDMQRYHKLLAGASWMAEYGDPDVPEEWEFIQRFSPYHNMRADGRYPRVLFTTSTRDDRVHPGHARKMMALMSD
jgi:prolyl oligopeptidase